MSNDPVDIVNTKNFINIARDVEFSDLRILLNENTQLSPYYNHIVFYRLHDPVYA